MERMTVRRADNGKWAIANNDGANPTEQMLKIPKAIDRLAEYEDICPDPALIAKQLEILKFYTDCLKGVGLGRLSELAEAEREGRTKVLPCDVNSTAFYVDEEMHRVLEGYIASYSYLSDYAVYFEFNNVESDIEWVSVECPVDDFGKTVFLSQGDAEARLAELLKKEETPNA